MLNILFKHYYAKQKKKTTKKAFGLCKNYQIAPEGEIGQNSSNDITKRYLKHIKHIRLEIEYKICKITFWPPYFAKLQNGSKKLFLLQKQHLKQL